MGNVTEQTHLEPLKARLNLLLDSYRCALHADEARLRAAMLEYQRHCVPEPLAQAA